MNTNFRDRTSSVSFDSHGFSPITTGIPLFNISKTQAAEIVKQKDSQNIHISGSLIKTKAKEVAKALEFQNFSASHGWLNKWRRRHKISFKCISEKLPGVLLGYKLEDIYNADESGLYFKALSDQTSTFKGKTCAGNKMAKVRLTILFCANVAGEKEKLLVIEKAARPRTLKNTSLKNFDKRMRFQKRKILFFLDNAASHPRELNLNNIKNIFPLIQHLCVSPWIKSSKSQYVDFINFYQGLSIEETFNENSEIERNVKEDEFMEDSDDTEDVEETSNPINSYTNTLKPKYLNKKKYYMVGLDSIERLSFVHDI
ncbi:tigger transposable element-derived protein 6-like [Euwallacea similis]|uniref:tigger transposable element-derived protein 6-like n=1 Tax=Euwallacea similis TaxID=1736056 RepID=UPI0034502701